MTKSTRPTKPQASTTPTGATILSRFAGPQYTSQQAADLFAREYWPGENRIAVNLSGGWKHVVRNLSEFAGTFNVAGKDGEGRATYRLTCNTAGVWAVSREG